MTGLRRPRIVPGNRITLLKNGTEFFPALVSAIDGATTEIRLETYIFRDDVAGINIAEALKRAAQRGVNVRVLIDGFGSYLTPNAFFENMQQAGVEVLVFRPEKERFNFRKSRLRRFHRKIGLIDGRVGFVGGINLIDDMTECLSECPRYDYAVQIEGPVLADIYLEMVRMWRMVSWWKQGPSASNDRPNSIRSDISADISMLREANSNKGNAQILFAVRDNFRHRRDIERTYLAAMANARREIIISSPYFLPGRHFRRALIAATQRGVQVTLLLQGRADHRLLKLATRALYTQLLGAGIAIYEYERSMLHGKVAVIDDIWSTVGSSNLDPFSLFLNREANAVVIDKAFASTLRDSVMAEIRLNAIALEPQLWHKRGRLIRVSSWIAYGFARWVMGWLGFAKRWD